MSTASRVPETWELTGDDARKTLASVGIGQLAKDSWQRLRFADGFSHARSLAFTISLVLVQAIIALVGLAAVMGKGAPSDIIVRSLQAAVPGPAGRTLTSAVAQAHRAGVAHEYFGLAFGLIGSLITGSTLMGQVERALNRLYGVEQDRPSVQKYGLALVLAVSAGLLATLATASLAFGRSIGHSLPDAAGSAWGVARWPLGLLLMMAAIALLFRCSPRRHQPRWSWLALGATVSVVLWCAVTMGLGAFFSSSSSFGDTYGPLAGMVALLLWSLLSSVALLFGASLAAQLEAVRAGAAEPQDERKVAGIGARELRARDRRLAMTSPLPHHSDHSEQRFRRTLEGVLGVPATERNRVDVLRNGDEIFPAMMDAVDGAENTIDFLTFVYWQGAIGDEFAHRLAARASAGVRVRVLLDGWGAHPMDPVLVDLMTEAGVRLHWFRPIQKLRPSTLNHRTHRKVMVVDESTAFTGGVGIADEWRGDARDPSEWRDTHFRVRGPAVDGLRSAFLDNWAETDAELFDDRFDRFPEQPEAGDAVVQCVRGASETGWSDVATLVRTLLQLACERVRITTAYFVPDEDILRRIRDARDRGVEVQILIPGPHADKRFVQLAGEACFAPLLDAGVQIYSYQTSMLHAKVMTIDGLVSNIGSANFNSRSTACDEEVNLVTIDRDLTQLLDRHFDEDLDRSVALSADRWERRPLTQRAFERATSPVRRVF